MNIPRPEYPRPDLYRPRWLNLNGVWECAFYEADALESAFEQRLRQFQNTPLPLSITVPFPYQSSLSGIGTDDVVPSVIYRRTFTVPTEWAGRRVLLHFGAVDYHTTVWVNDIMAGQHRGGHVPFSFDITPHLHEGDNTLILKVVDLPDVDQPRGKQSWCHPFACWYTPTTGVWQTVWLEAVPQQSIESVRIVPDIDDGSVSILVRPNGPCEGLELTAEASFNGRAVGRASRSASYPATQLRITIDDAQLWSPENPNLYDLKLSLLRDGEVVDVVDTYFGMRKVGLSHGMLLLNNEPYYQRLVLDQGFWPDGLLTAPSDDALKADIEWAKKMGFNGCRKHMKVEDPRFLYWADKLGFLVWGEFPANYDHSLSGEAKFLPEWQASIQRDINHPCIIAWTPFNESWGIKDVKDNPDTQRWVRDVVQQTRLIDPTRLVLDNDGWEHVGGDIYGYHDYTADGQKLIENYNDLLERAKSPDRHGPSSINSGRDMMADGLCLPDMPVMNTEFGGIGYVMGEQPEDAWGYADMPATEAEFKQRYEKTFEALYALPGNCGYVYTQLTDVQQEINGLLTPDRQPKFDVEWLRSVNTRQPENQPA